jgi:hypothetical protein
MQVMSFPYTWAFGHHFHNEEGDSGHLTFDCRVEFEINQSSHPRLYEKNLIERKIGYIRKLQEIM